MLIEKLKPHEDFIYGPIDTMFQTSPRVGFVSFDIHSDESCEAKIFECNSSNFESEYPVTELKTLSISKYEVLQTDKIELAKRYCKLVITNNSDNECTLNISTNFDGEKRVNENPSNTKPKLNSFEPIKIKAMSNSPIEFVEKSLPSKIKFSINGNTYAFIPVTWDTSNLKRPLKDTEIIGTLHTTICDSSTVNVKADLEVALSETFKGEVASISEISEILSSGTKKLDLTLTEDLDLRQGENKTINVSEGVDLTLNLANRAIVKCSENTFNVKDGKLKLEGDGFIISNSKKSSGVITASGENSCIEINGVTIDVVSENGKANNYAYGVFAKNGARVVFNDGVIKTAFGSCISTNNTTGGGEIIVNGGRLESDGSYAIYNAAQGVININGGVVQGINARMGTINISGKAEIIPTTITSETYDDIGLNVNTSGCIWFGDTIAIVAGTYTDKNGIDTVLNIKQGAVVRSNFRSAIGIYLVDTKSDSSVNVNIDKNYQVSTSALGFENIQIYDHDYIANAAAENNKEYTPKANSSVEITIADKVA